MRNVSRRCQLYHSRLSMEMHLKRVNPFYTVPNYSLQTMVGNSYISNSSSGACVLSFQFVIRSYTIPVTVTNGMQAVLRGLFSPRWMFSINRTNYDFLNSKPLGYLFLQHVSPRNPRSTCLSTRIRNKNC